MNKETLDKNLKPVFPLWVRIVLILLAYTIVAGLFQVIGMYITGVPIDDLEALENLTMNQLLVTQVLSAIATVLVVYLFRRYMDKKSMHSLGFSLAHRGADIFWAMVLAFVMIAGATLVLYLLGYIELVVNDFSLVTLSMSLLLFVSVSLSEEVLIRGYILNNLMTSMNKYMALVLSATIFTLFHLFNLHLSVLSVVNLFIAGILLGTAYIYTKNLWFSISLHTFWNFFQGSIFGYPVSGQKVDSILQLKYIENNTIITGGDFGFEGSILSTIVTVVLILTIIWFYENKLYTKSSHQ